jgi:hypothetical protein
VSNDPAHQLNRLECQADFTYEITVKAIKTQETGKDKKSVADDLGAVRSRTYHDADCRA